jgi:pyrroloquinoline quinone biosynthesis protein D
VSAVSPDHRPRLAAKARLRWDRKAARYLLLYPERGLVLNATAADVVQLCTGEHTVSDIIERLTARYAAQPRAAIEQEVLTFLARMAERGLIRNGDD